MLQLKSRGARKFLAVFVVASLFTIVITNNRTALWLQRHTVISDGQVFLRKAAVRVPDNWVLVLSRQRSDSGAKYYGVVPSNFLPNNAQPPSEPFYSFRPLNSWRSQITIIEIGDRPPPLFANTKLGDQDSADARGTWTQIAYQGVTALRYLSRDSSHEAILYLPALAVMIVYPPDQEALAFRMEVVGLNSTK